MNLGGIHGAKKCPTLIWIGHGAMAERAVWALRMMRVKNKRRRMQKEREKSNQKKKERRSGEKRTRGDSKNG